MNILYLTISDLSDLNKRGIYTDLIGEFVKHGHTVSIVTPAERRKKESTRLVKHERHQVLQVRTGNLFRTNLLEKGISNLLIEWQYKKAIKQYFSGIKFDLVLFAFEQGAAGDILVQKAPSCTIETQARAVIELFKHQSPDGVTPKIKTIGIRHGEKMYETLLTNEECAGAIDLGNFYRVPSDKRDLNYSIYFSKGDVQRNTLREFNSNNTVLLDVEQAKAKITALTYIQEQLAE